MSISYDTDVIAWADEQATLLRAGRFSELDIEHIADEVEDVGKSERRELVSRLAVLLAHLIKWRFQPERRGVSWRVTINHQRNAIAHHIAETPSLKATLRNDGWWSVAWGDAVTQAASEARLMDLPEVCPWSREQVLDAEFFPTD